MNFSYNAIECTCAQWTETIKGIDTERVYYFMQPANDKLINADKLWKGNNIPLEIQVKGQIVSYSGYPTGYPIKGDSKPAIVFRYTDIKVIENGKARKN